MRYRLRRHRTSRKKRLRRNPLTPEALSEVDYFVGATPYAIGSYEGYSPGDMIRLYPLLETLKLQLPPSQLKNEVDYFAYILVANQAAGLDLEMADLYRLSSLFENIKQTYRLPPSYQQVVGLPRRSPTSILERAQMWVDPLLEQLYKDPYFEIIADHAARLCGGPIYLVGGQIFRRLANLMHGSSLRVDKDWDFLCLGVPSSDYYFHKAAPVWAEDWDEMSIRGYFTTRFSYKPYKEILSKLDIISIFDSQDILGGSLKEVEEILDQERYDDALEIYFDSVPLNIQALALDITNERLLGEQGLQAVWDQTLHLKRPEHLTKWDIDPKSYLKTKLKSLPGFVSV